MFTVATFTGFFGFFGFCGFFGGLTNFSGVETFVV